MKKLFFGLILLAVSILGFSAFAEMAPNPYPTHTKGEFSISAEMLNQAGFTNVESVTKSSGSSYYPNYYFKVKETVKSSDAALWGNASNLVSVFIRKIPIDWSYNFGQMKMNTINSRIQISAVKGKYYFVITGPNQLNTTNLLEIIENKYSPNIPNQ